MHCPRTLQPLWNLWLTASHALGRIMSFLILAVLWLTLFSIYGIILKILSISKFWQGEKTSYWVDPLPEVPDGMRHQF